MLEGRLWLGTHGFCARGLRAWGLRTETAPGDRVAAEAVQRTNAESGSTEAAAARPRPQPRTTATGQGLGPAASTTGGRRSRFYVRALKTTVTVLFQFVSKAPEYFSL